LYNNGLLVLLGFFAGGGVDGFEGGGYSSASLLQTQRSLKREGLILQGFLGFEQRSLTAYNR
jgi:hypothetical protein